MLEFGFYQYYLYLAYFMDSSSRNLYFKKVTLPGKTVLGLLVFIITFTNYSAIPLALST
jgi:hypothetical protein